MTAGKDETKKWHFPDLGGGYGYGVLCVMASMFEIKVEGV